MGIAIAGGSGYYFVERRLGEEELYRAADSSWQQGQYGEAARYFERLLARYPKGKLHQQVLLEAANNYCYYLRNINRSIDLYRTLLSTSSETKGRLAARRSLGEIYLRDVGDIGQAIEEYKALREEQQDEGDRQETSFMLGEAYFKRNEMNLALEEYRSAAESPVAGHLRDKANVRIGSVLQLQRQYAAAAGPFEQVLGNTQCPECRYQAQIGLVEALEGQEKFDAALRLLNSVQGTVEVESFKMKEKKRLEEKRSILRAESTVDWAGKRTQQQKAKE